MNIEITKCLGKSCVIKDRCMRFAKDAPDDNHFSESPFKIVNDAFTCEMYFGENSQSILNSLINICQSSPFSTK